MNIYRKTLLKLIDAHLGQKTRRLMTMKLEATTVGEKVAALNYEAKLEAELQDFNNLIANHKAALRYTGRIKEAA